MLCCLISTYFDIVFVLLQWIEAILAVLSDVVRCGCPREIPRLGVPLAYDSDSFRLQLRNATLLVSHTPMAPVNVISPSFENA
jgi:hypothetical protein